ncbi:MAG: PKD domain-containing protein [Paludibacter sp.]
MKQYFRFVFFFVILFFANYSSAAVGSLFSNDLTSYENITTQIAHVPAIISATISGTTTECQNASSPVVTFTGFGGTPPYTFTYSINNGSNTPIKTTSGSSVTLAVPTNVAGIFVYSLKSVSDANSTEPQTGTATVTINPLPIIDFSFPDNQCSGTAIQFTSTVTGSGSYSYNWDFGDSSISFDQNPTHKFTTGFGTGSQTFNVQLTVTNLTTNCSESITKPITLYQIPDATITGSGSGKIINGVTVFETCANAVATLSFTNASTTISSNLKYTINWGDGTADFVSTSWSTITHSFKIGLWNVVYTVEGPNGCSTVQPYIVFIGANPAVILGKPANTDICNPTTLTFPIQGTRNNPAGTTYTVTYSDGSAAEVYNHPPPSTVSHTFTKSSCGTTSGAFPNSFSATIVAENPCGKSEGVVAPIYVSSTPVANFTLPGSVVCSNSSICLTNTSTQGNTAGSSGCLNPSAVWSISPSTGVTLASGSLGNDSGSANPGVWTSGSNVICPVFSIPGTYSITLKLGNKCGIAQKTQTICVEGPITPLFTIDTNTGCTPLTVTTTNSTIVTDACTAPVYKWDVSYTAGNCGTTSAFTYTNGTSSSSNNPSFQFTNPGTYTIQLSVGNACGNKSTTQTVTVKKTPTVAINDIPDYCGTASINPTAVVNSCSPTSGFTWSFPGGTPSTANTENPGTITYNTPGNYEVSLSIFNECGVSITSIKTFKVNQIPVLTNSDLSQTLCSGQQTIPVTLTSDISGTAFTWTATATAGVSGFTASGDTNTIPAQTITTSDNVPGTVTYAITPKSGNCSGAVTNYVITVNPVAVFTSQPDSSTVCQGGTATTLSVSFTGVSSAPAYQWYTNTDDNTSTGTEISGATNATYDPLSTIPGITYYYCVISFPSGGVCNGITSNTARVTVAAIPTFSTEPKPLQNICVGGTVPLSVSYSGGAGTPSYQWFSNTTNSNNGGTAISGATNSSFTPPVFTIIGSYYYYVELTLSVGSCGSITSNSAQINVVTDPVINNPQPLITQTVCQGSTPSKLVVVVTGGVGKYNFQWFINASNNTTTGTQILGANDSIYIPSTISVSKNYYYCLVTQAPGLNCEVVSNTAEVNVMSSPVFSKQPVSESVCLNGIPKTLTVEYINGSGIPLYQWYSNNSDDNTTGTQIIGETNSSYSPPSSSLGTTYYYCIITLPTGTCSVITSNTARITVNAVPAISVQPSPLINICVGGTTSTPLHISYTGGAGNASYQWYSNNVNSNVGGSIIPGATDSLFTPAVFTIPKNYYFYLVLTFSGSGCGSLTSNTTEIAVVSDPVVTLQPVVSQILCQSTGSADLKVAASGGLGAFSYQWYKNSVNDMSTGSIIPGAITSTYTPPTSIVGTSYYYCLITQPSGLGCDATSNTSELIVVPPPTFVDQPASSTICEGGTPTVLSVTYINGVGKASYQWYQNTLNNNTTGTLVPGATDSVYTTPVPVIGTMYYYCKITLSAGGCNNLTSSLAQITVNPNPVISEHDLLICSGETFSVIPTNFNGDVVPVGTTYTWSDPVISPIGTISGTSANTTAKNSISQTLVNNSIRLATATYTVTPISGVCAGSDFNVVVTVNPQINISATINNITCAGANDGKITSSITGGIPYTITNPYLTTWTGPNGFSSNAINLSGLKPGVYQLTAIDSTGCSNIKSFTVLDPGPITITTDNIKNIDCFGAANGSISLTVSGGTLPYSFAWTKDGIAYANTEDLVDCGPGVYDFTVTDKNNCAPQTASFTLTESSKIVITSSITHIINNADARSGAINIFVTGGNPPYTYAWSNGATTKDISNIPEGNYLVSVTDSKQCIQMAQFEVFTQKPIVLNVSLKNDFDCSTKEPVKVCTAIVTGGIPPYQFVWSRGIVSGVNNEIMTANQNGTVNLKVTDAYGLTSSILFNIETFVGIDYKLIDCTRYLSQFNALDPDVVGQNYSFSWDFGDGENSTLKNVQHSFSTYGTYNVKLTISSESCSSIYQKTVVFAPLPKLLYENEIKLCEGDSIVQRVTNAVTHRWSDDSMADSLMIKHKGDYSVICTSTDGCLDTLNFKVTCDLFNYTIQSDREELSLDKKPLHLWSENIPFSNYSWDFGDGTVGNGYDVEHSFNVLKEGYYDVKLKVINPNGCPEYATKRFWIVNNSVTNSFSPNGDGVNDVFLEGWHIKVYNRNGILIFEGNNGWDGTYKGSIVSNGTYFFIMDYISESGPKYKEGYVMVAK